MIDSSPRNHTAVPAVWRAPRLVAPSTLQQHINVIERYETWRIPDDDEHLSEDEPLVNLRSKHAHKRYKDAKRQGNG